MKTKLKDLLKRLPKKAIMFSGGAASVIVAAAICTSTANASIDYSVYKSALDNKLNSQGVLEINHVDETSTNTLYFDTADIELLSDKIAQQQYYLNNVVSNSVNGSASLNPNSVVVTDKDSSLTTILTDGSGNVLANAIIGNELENLNTKDTFEINVYDTDGKSTGVTTQVSDVTMRDLYNNKYDNTSFTGKGNIQDNIDKLQEIIDGIEDAGWN